MRLANTTFVNLRRALDDLTPLVDASKPVAPKLQQLLAQLRPLAQDAVPTVRDVWRTSSAAPAPNNDLIDLTNLGVPLAAVTVHPVQANGKQRPGAFPQSTIALNDFTPELATARPYAVDAHRLVRGVLASGNDRRQRRREPSRGDARRALGGRRRAAELAPAFATADQGRAAADGPGRRVDRVPGRPLPGIDRARRAVLPARAVSRVTRSQVPTGP